MVAFEYDIIRTIGVIAERSKDWKRELNIVEWNGGPAKYDIRDWSPDHQKMGRGVSLTRDELKALCELFAKEEAAQEAAPKASQDASSTAEEDNANNNAENSA